jgi:hypothetical protein
VHLSRLLAFLCVFSAFISGSSPVSAEPSQTETIRLGHSTAALNGPWRFHTGDDLRWSLPDFDDSTWDTVDLTPAPGAHDGDVGLPGYVSGWSKRGHAGYTGYAWYRLKVTIDSDKDAQLALAGPTLVDSTYQLYVDGKLLGGPGVFTGKAPAVYSVRPSVFPLPAASSAGSRTYLIALRVWMDPVDAGEDSGGIHIAPTIGYANGIDLLHQVQWLETFKGYVVDALEPAAFVLLAMMVLGLMASRTDDSYRWLGAALLFLALLRINQVTFAWTHLQSLRCYDIATAVILKPLALAAWTMAWRDWFRLGKPWLRYAVSVLTVVYLVFALIGRPWFVPEATHGIKMAANIVVEGARLIYAALYLWIIGLGVMRPGKPSAYLAAVAAILVGIGLFATELNALGLPGIWFPYGTGVARGQYAYALFIVVLFVLILMRLVEYARTSKDMTAVPRE